MIEKMYGEGVFYEDALNDILPEAYDKAVEELGLTTASRPQVDVENISKEEVIVNALVAVRPEITLGDYKNLDVAKDAVIVTEDDVEEEVKKTAERNSRMVEVTDRAAELNDTVTIDYEGSIDGVPFDGGKAEDHALVLGSHSFIDTFEDQLVGKNVGDDVEVNVTFPEDYNAKELAGKPALFKVAVKKIQKKEVPAIDDEFAQDVSEFDTLDEYKADVRVKLTERKQREADNKYRQDLLDKLVEQTEMDIPDAMVETEAEGMVNNFAQSLAQQGMNMEQYMKITGGNMASLINTVRPEALKNIKQTLILDAVAKAEGLEITDEDIDKQIKDMAEMYRMEEEQVRTALGEAGIASMKDDLLRQKAGEALVQA